MGKMLFFPKLQALFHLIPQMVQKEFYCQAEAAQPVQQEGSIPEKEEIHMKINVEADGNTIVYELNDSRAARVA
ncbi:hypothetical protein [Enterocloster citroniae]|uniref:hypothetical protein n=3 Tax=Enterocloster citroniae TaxID=358743 RepID=UPI001D06CCFD|nr:hypothetical protein [Enterocloster citroniae]MCB7062765.1 hypothetical protein [Enterocloster citroniae]MCC8084895.1 hypothetical protein [Clostridium sp.]